MNCPKYSFKAFFKHGFVVIKGEKKPRFCCKNCGCRFTKSVKKGVNFKIRIGLDILRKLLKNIHQILDLMRNLILCKLMRFSLI